MPPLDTSLTVYNQLWTLLEASPTFTSLVLVGNRLKATAQRVSERDAVKSAPADFPKVRIDIADETDNDRSPKVFGQNTTTFTASDCDYGVPIRLNVTIKIVHDDTRLAYQTPVEAAVRGAILLHGRNLGIDWVTNVVMQGAKRAVENSPDTNGTQRTISKIRLEVTARPKLSLLTAGSTI